MFWWLGKSNVQQCPASLLDPPPPFSLSLPPSTHSVSLATNSNAPLSAFNPMVIACRMTLPGCRRVTAEQRRACLGVGLKVAGWLLVVTGAPLPLPPSIPPTLRPGTGLS